MCNLPLKVRKQGKRLAARLTKDLHAGRSPFGWVLDAGNRLGNGLKLLIRRHCLEIANLQPKSPNLISSLGSLITSSSKGLLHLIDEATHVLGLHAVVLKGAA